MTPARPGAPRAEISFSGWGDPDRATGLSDELHALLRGALGVREGRPAPGSPADVALEAPRLATATRNALAEIVGTAHAHDDHASRARHARGKSTIDLLSLRQPGPLSAPDLVLMPGSHDEVQAVLELASARHVAVIPFGGGTSVVGGVQPPADQPAGTVALDLGRLDALVSLDETSRLAVIGPGLRGPEAEVMLNARGYTLGHFPQSFEYATLGGFAAARSSGQASAGYGRFEDHVMALRVATPAGPLQLGRAPRSAAGPDLRQLVLGSEGALGVITELTLAVVPAPEERHYEGWMLPSFAAGGAVLRRLAQDGPRATVLRLSDEAETALNGGTPAGGCLAIAGWEGHGQDVAARREATATLLRDAGGVPVADAGEAWAAGRYQAPYLRDALLDAGALVETLETAAFWSALPGLYAAVSTALRDSLTGQGSPPAILCHISHVYPSGASLYFTVACAQLEDPIAQWRTAKAAAGDAILAAGGSITHHHGVGRDHREHYAREIGTLGVEVMHAVKRALDPHGILNPGALLDP